MAVRLADGTYGPGSEELHFPRWDRFILAAATLEHTLFNLRPGDARAGAALTRADTNNTGAQIPNKQKWEIWTWHFFYQAIAIRNDAAMQNILDMFRNTIFSLQVESKDTLFEGQLGLFHDGPKQIVHVPTAAANNISPQSFGIYMGRIELKVPIVLQQLTTWDVQVEHIVAPNAALDGDLVMFYLDTHLYRMH